MCKNELGPHWAYTINTRAADYYGGRKLKLSAVRWKAHFAMDIQMTMPKARFGLKYVPRIKQVDGTGY